MRAWLSVVLLCLAAFAHAEPVELEPRGDTGVENRWGVGIAYGVQRYSSEESVSNGTSAALQLTYRAFKDIRTPWLFELGFERSLSQSNPEIAGEEVRIQSTGVFYRFSYLFTPRWYAGARIGFARVRGAGEENDGEDLDSVFGLQTGTRVTPWLDLGIETVFTDPDSDGAYPADVRAVLTVSF